MINKDFEKLVKENTREEFNKKFKIVDLRNCGEEYIVLTDNREIELACPYDKECSENEDCIKCWEEAIKKSKFKGED